MKQPSEFEFVKNLTWKKVSAIFAGFLSFGAIYTSIIWTIGTRAADSRADYVNMRYNELTSMEEKLKTLEDENNALKIQCGKAVSSPSVLNNTEKNVKVGATDIDTKTNTIVSVRDVYDGSAYVTIVFPDGKEYSSSSISVGFNRVFEIKDKKYQIIITEIKTRESLKYLVRAL